MWGRLAESAPASCSLILEKKSIRVVPQGSGGGSALIRRDSILLCWLSCIVLTGELGPGRKGAMVLPSKRKAHVYFYHLWKDTKGLHLELLLG